jgi:precorrin-2 dehydrogenase/sirohydrochlorin ferrochelatase
MKAVRGESMKKYYPVMLDIEGKKCTVIGGGRVAIRKVESLIECGAIVTVISPEVIAEFERLASGRMVELEKRPYLRGDLRGSFLVFVATDDNEVNKACQQEAEEEGILINVVDVPQLCDFIVPAVHRQGNLTITVSTDGKSPMFSRKIREDLEKTYGPQYKIIIDVLGEIREKALKEIKDINLRKELFHELTYSRSIDKIEDFDDYTDEMWRIFQSYRNREG